MTAATVHHPLFARVYDRVSHVAEQKGAAGHRDELLGGLSGRVIELGAGNGLNFDHYPTTVSEVVAVEPEPYLRRLAEQAAKHVQVPVTVIDGVAQALPVDTETFDAGVAAPRAGVARVQRVLDRTVWPLFAGGCHASRDTLAAIDAAGFVVEDIWRFTFRPTRVDFVTAPHILGRARRP